MRLWSDVGWVRLVQHNVQMEYTKFYEKEDKVRRNILGQFSRLLCNLTVQKTRSEEIVFLLLHGASVSHCILSTWRFVITTLY
jgi:hypothetical protein